MDKHWLREALFTSYTFCHKCHKLDDLLTSQTCFLQGILGWPWFEKMLSDILQCPHKSRTGVENMLCKEAIRDSWPENLPSLRSRPKDHSSHSSYSSHLLWVLDFPWFSRRSFRDLPMLPPVLTCFTPFQWTAHPALLRSLLRKAFGSRLWAWPAAWSSYFLHIHHRLDDNLVNIQ